MNVDLARVEFGWDRLPRRIHMLMLRIPVSSFRISRRPRPTHLSRPSSTEGVTMSLVPAAGRLPVGEAEGKGP